MIKGILFDFAGVIGADGYWIWLRENVPDIETHRNYFQEISERVDSGAITNKEFVRLIAEKSEKPVASVWPGIKDRIVINKELLQYIDGLKKPYRIGLLSNFTHDWLDEIFEFYSLQRYFDVLFISSREKLIKPQPAAFQRALELLGTSREETVFIDDRQMNVDAGNAIGLRSILFTSTDQFEKDPAATLHFTPGV